MPIYKNPYYDDAEIDSIIDSAELEKLRKKYEAIDSDTSVSQENQNDPRKEPSTAKRTKEFLKTRPIAAGDSVVSEMDEIGKTEPNLPESSDEVIDIDFLAEVAAAFQSAASAEPEVKQQELPADEQQTGEMQPASKSDPPAQVQTDDTEVISDDSLEKLMSSFRVVYEESVNKLGSHFIADEEVFQQPLPVNISAPGKEQHRESRDKNEQFTDFISSLRIVYEDPEDDFPAENQATVPDDKPLPLSQALPSEPETASLFENVSPSAGLAELFHDLSEDNTSPQENGFKRLIKKIFPCRGDGIGEAIRKTILFIAIITMLVCGVILLNIYVVAPYFSSRDSQKAIDIKTNSNLSADWATAEGKYPDIDFPAGMQLKYAEFYAINKDFSGWLDIPGTDIDMPIVKGKDNNEYLKKTFYGEKSKYGCCFLDSSNSINKLDRNTVIYGHNMSYDNLMFGSLEVYKKMDGFKNSPVINFGTLYKDTKWKIYAVFIMNGSSNDDNGYLFNYIFRNLSSDEAFLSYIKQLDQRKLYTTGVDILPSDKLLTLSTCLYDFKNARLAVVARLVREGESTEVDVSKVSLNKNPRYPQKWYDAVKQTNPYKDAEKWFPN